MNDSSPAIDLRSLKMAEADCRQRLRDRPDDLNARVRLAWCLFVHASYRAGEERVLAELIGPGAAGEEAIRGLLDSIRSQNADHLLTECLRHVFIVTQLSTHPGQASDAQELKCLVRLASGEQAVSQAEERTTAALQRLVKAILEGDEEADAWRH